MQKIFQRFNWQFPRIVASLAEGEDATHLHENFIEDIKRNYNNNLNLRVLSYDEETRALIGSNSFVVSRLTELLENSGLRTAIPSDDRYGDISRLIRDRAYIDFNALILRKVGDSYKPNDKLVKDLAEKIEQKQGKLKLPVMIVNPVVRASEKNGDYYGLVFDLSDKSLVIEDERLDGEKYNGRKFNEVDDLGLPIFKGGGKRRWHAREDNICRFYINKILDTYSYDENLAASYADGRVVLILGPAMPENF